MLRGATRTARPPDGPRAPCATMVRATPADPRSEPGSLLMTRSIPRLLGYATVAAGVTAAGYVGLVTGACPIDLGIGRRIRPLGPQLVDMAAPRELVFDVIAEPYLGRAPRALADKLGGAGLRAAGSRRSRPRWRQSRPRPNGARRASWDAGAPAPAVRPQPPAESPDRLGDVAPVGALRSPRTDGPVAGVATWAVARWSRRGPCRPSGTGPRPPGAGQSYESRLG
jgi:hypothetical protein